MPSSVPKARTDANDDVGLQIVTPCMQDVRDAAYRVAHEFPGGVPALAQRMGMSANTLNLKVSLTVETHHLSLRESVHMQHVAQRFDVLYAMGMALDHVCHPASSTDPARISERLTRVGAEVGDVFRVAQASLADGSITPRERRKLSKEISEAIAALNAVQQVL